MSGFSLRRALPEAANRLLERLLPKDEVVPVVEERGAFLVAKSTISGLVSVGVPLHEAVQPFMAELTIKEAIGLAKELEPDDVSRMYELYDVQKHISDKRAFGKACVEAGFHPAGVALTMLDKRDHRGGFGLDPNAIMNTVLNGPSVAKYEVIDRPRVCSEAILAFGVDTWMAEGLDGERGFGGFSVKDNELHKVSAPLIVPCDFWIKRNGLIAAALPAWLTSQKTTDVPWLRTVGGTIGFEGRQSVNLSNLISVGSIMLANSSRASRHFFPSLQTVRDMVTVQYSDGLSFPKLTSIGGTLFADRSENLSLPVLRTVGHKADFSNSKNVQAGCLEVVNGAISVGGAIGLTIPNLRTVKGKPYSGGSVE